MCVCVCGESLCVASRELCGVSWASCVLVGYKPKSCVYVRNWRTTEIWDGLANENIPLENIMSADRVRVVSCIQNL